MARTRPTGFTLIEVATALMIVAMAVAIAVPAYRNLDEGDDMDRATRRVQTLFRMARDSAIQSGVPVTVVIDSLDGLVWIDAPEPMNLGSAEVREALAYPEVERGEPTEAPIEMGEPIGLPPTVRMELLRARARFTFQPGGGTLGDTLILDGPMGARIVTLDPWTGDVSIR